MSEASGTKFCWPRVIWDVWSRLGEAIALEDAVPDVKKDWYLEWGKDDGSRYDLRQSHAFLLRRWPAPMLGVYDFGSINTLVDIAGATAATSSR